MLIPQKSAYCLKALNPKAALSKQSRHAYDVPASNSNVVPIKAEQQVLNKFELSCAYKLHPMLTSHNCNDVHAPTPLACIVMLDAVISSLLLQVDQRNYSF